MQVVGKTKEFITPTGDVITIREQNGNDDDVLSNIKSAKEGKSFNKFIQGIVLNSLRYGGTLTDDNVMDMPVRDKNFILIQSRIFSLGNEVEFKWNWGTQEKPDFKPYMEDLNDYIWDYALPFPKEGEENYNKERVEPYQTEDTFIELTLSSEKVVRFDYLNGRGEKYILECRDKDNLSINTSLLARNFRLRNLNGNFDIIQNFSCFSSMDMKEIRSYLSKYDREFELMSDITHPKTGITESVSLIQLPDFFFPLLEI